MNKCLKKVLIAGAAGIAEAIVIIKQMNKKILSKAKMSAERNDANFQVLKVWLQVKQAGRSLETYLKQKGIEKIAIYGMSDIGQLLYQELKDSEIETAYGIDKNSKSVHMEDIRVAGLDETLEPVDAIIVTAVYFYPEIRKELLSKTEAAILSLEDVLYDMLTMDK